MSLKKEFFNRETNIKATVICDSISEAGHRITTFEIEYPRFILAELNTHNALEKNSSSSRAIPILAMIKQIQSNMGVPLYWGKTKAGMQADDEIYDVYNAERCWLSAFNNMKYKVNKLSDLGLHKQTANRLLEPFQMMKTVITGTDWDNFFNLRIHPDAQPEFCMLAYKMYEAMQASIPNLIKDGEWHLPYIKFDRDNEGNAMYLPFDEDRIEGYIEYSLEEAQRVSASCTAQTSYRKSDDSLEKADKVFKMLIDADVLHASPFGHLATPVSESVHVLGHDGMGFCDDLSLSVNTIASETWERGVTHIRRDGTLCSGNLAGFISYRHLLPNNTCWEYDHDKRMELFS